MDKNLIVFIAQVKHSSSGNTHLTARSYLVEKNSTKDLDSFSYEFKRDVEQDEFKIVNFHVYIVPDEQRQMSNEPT